MIGKKIWMLSLPVFKLAVKIVFLDNYIIDIH